jgi:3-hydroxy-9,10-secoandrosta-1,3,5(10)-triene-9,17-dione monooxygenase reductase component
MTVNGTLRAIDATHFRQVMRHLPSSVVAICAEDPEDGRPCGLIAGTFQSLSLEPALVTFSVARSSTSWPKISRADHFSVNILADGQQGICRALSSKGGDKFLTIDWQDSVYRTPHIQGSLGWIDCAIGHELDGGDHLIVIANVLEMYAGEGDPLVFHCGKLGSFRETVAA